MPLKDLEKRREYHRLYMRDRWYPENKTKHLLVVQKGAVLRKYGLTEDDYQRLLAKQNGVCVICQEEVITRRRLSVDHDHETNRVRGLLCRDCNSMLGQAKDKVSTLRRAIAYLEGTLL